MNKSDYNIIKKKFKHKNNQLYYIHTDQLNSPRAITNNNQATVWKWDNTDPFGNNQPTNLGIDFNLRFPGQYADNESGLFYNYYRYYNPETGRYNQVDPIGISGGYDVYGYVNQNPIKFSDKLGLDIAIIYDGNSLSGHVSLAVVNSNQNLREVSQVGFYPRVKNIGDISNIIYGDGTLNTEIPEKEKKYEALVIKSTIEQELEITKLINKAKIHNVFGKYSLPLYTCATFAEDTLKQIGLIPKNLNNGSPNSFFYFNNNYIIPSNFFIKIKSLNIGKEIVF